VPWRPCSQPRAHPWPRRQEAAPSGLRLRGRQTERRCNIQQVLSPISQTFMLQRTQASIRAGMHRRSERRSQVLGRTSAQQSLPARPVTHTHQCQYAQHQLAQPCAASEAFPQPLTPAKPTCSNQHNPLAAVSSLKQIQQCPRHSLPGPCPTCHRQRRGLRGSGALRVRARPRGGALRPSTAGATSQHSGAGTGICPGMLFCTSAQHFGLPRRAGKDKLQVLVCARVSSPVVFKC